MYKDAQDMVTALEELYPENWACGLSWKERPPGQDRWTGSWITQLLCLWEVGETDYGEDPDSENFKAY